MDVEKIAGYPVGLRHAGQGAPTLLIHCALAHSGALSGLMGLLGQSLQMTAFDLPGHGQTALDDRVDFQDQSVEIALELLKRSPNPSHLVGHSFGATVALRLAVEYPEMVASLSLYEPVYFGMLHKADLGAYLQEEQDSAVFVQAALAHNWPDAARAFLQRWSAEDFDKLPAPQQAYIVATIPLILASHKSIVAPERAGKILARLGQLRLPVLLLEGGDSPRVTHRINNVIERAIPRTIRHRIKGAGHMGMLTHAPKIAALLQRHILPIK